MPQNESVTFLSRRKHTNVIFTCFTNIIACNELVLRCRLKKLQKAVFFFEAVNFLQDYKLIIIISVKINMIIIITYSFPLFS
jgi:hypothetical protein